jgi:hypothetical protein
MPESACRFLLRYPDKTWYSCGGPQQEPLVMSNYCRTPI